MFGKGFNSVESDLEGIGLMVEKWVMKRLRIRRREFVKEIGGKILTSGT